MRTLERSIVLFLLTLAGCGSDDAPAASAQDSGTPIDSQLADDTAIADSGSEDTSVDTSVDAPETSVGPKAGTTASLALLETTDLHANILGYDYYKLAADPSIGFERTATLIAQARKEFPNALLLDNGDTIQGTILADYQATVAPVSCDKALAMYKAMNALKYDAAGIGNHEFNFGLDYLGQVTHTAFEVDGLSSAPKTTCKGPEFPQVLANVYSKKNDKTLYPPYVVLDREIKAKDPSGAEVTAHVKVGVIAFTPPTIVDWDKRWLDGKVYTTGAKDAADKYVAELRSKVDVLVAISHSGLDNTAPYVSTIENGGWWLSKVPGIDALLLGHSHQIFPNAKSTVAQFDLPDVDKAKGTVSGVPTVMANLWGQHLGVIAMQLAWDGSKWSIQKDKTVVEARPIGTTCDVTTHQPTACDAGKWRTGAACPFDCSAVTDAKKKIYVDADLSIATLVSSEHDATIAYVKTPVGTTDFRMTSYFADVGDPTAIEIVNQAQADYVAKFVAASIPAEKDTPVLSVSAPFKSGFNGGADYTDVASGSIAINNAADLYLYPNTIYAVKVTGKDVRAWLETAATRFNQIDKAKSDDQPLINPKQPGYNFDMFTTADLSYEIDVTQPAGSRIQSLKYKGADVADDKTFIVATNNYRASGGGMFPGLDGRACSATKAPPCVIVSAPDANRDVVVAYIKKTGSLTRAANGSHRSWRFTKVTTTGKVTFTSAKGVLDLATSAGLTGISVLKDDDGSGKNLSVYALDLSK